MPQGLPTVIPNDIVLASHMNSVADRVVGRFATAAERDAAIPSPVNGMVVYRADLAGGLEVRHAGAWTPAAMPPILGWSEMTSNSGAFGSTAAPSTLIVNATNLAGRKVHVACSVIMAPTTAVATQLRAFIRLDDASDICRGVGYVPGQFYSTLFLQRVITPAAGTHKYQLWVHTDAGQAIIDAATTPATLIVSDGG